MKDSTITTGTLEDLETQHRALFVKLFDEVKERSLADFIIYDQLAEKIANAKALEGYTKGYHECYRDMQDINIRDLA